MGRDMEGISKVSFVIAIASFAISVLAIILKLCL